MTRMHDINCARENSHIKTNIVHTLFRMQKVGTLPPDNFHELLTPEELAIANKNLEEHKDSKPWYNLLQTKFLDYIHSVSILAQQHHLRYSKCTFFYLLI